MVAGVPVMNEQYGTPAISTLALRFHVLSARPRTFSARARWHAGYIADGSEIPHGILNLGCCTWSAGREVVVLRGVSRLLGARHGGGVSERGRARHADAFLATSPPPTRRTRPHRAETGHAGPMSTRRHPNVTTAFAVIFLFRS